MPFLSVILPTYNEAANIARVIERLGAALRGMDYEAIIVDDSTDGTDGIAAEIARTRPHIRVMHREGRHGLASAVVEGIGAARGEILCVLDADLQHPPETLPLLVEALERTGADVVVASRYVHGGRYDAFTLARRIASRAATALAKLLLHRARLVSDPLSGFFAFRRAVVKGIRLSPLGYKILLEVLVRGRVSRVVEIPYRFEARAAGQSKLTMQQNREYLGHVFRLLNAHPDDLRFVRFGLVGASGILVNMAVFWLLSAGIGVHYVRAGATAIALATTWNFLLNDAFTWRDRRSATPRRKAERYVQYWAVTSVGAGVHLLVLYLLTSAGLPYLLSNLVGIGTAVMWNFRTNTRWTWKPAEATGMQRLLYRRPSVQAPVSPSADGDLLRELDPGGAGAAVERRHEFVKYLKEGPVPRIHLMATDGGAPAPRVSVLIPSAGGARSHHLTLLLQQLKDQPFHPLEVIVVWGDRRQGRAINTAATIARGTLLITMDDDTQLGDPHVIEKLVAAFDADPAIGIAGVSNRVPDNAPPVVQRAMRELPRRSSAIVLRVTDSDMVEHPCLAIRRDVFLRIGGEHEVIPRGLDPYLRQEVRRLGYRVVVIPDAWIHHLLPPTLPGILRQYFRNGVGAAYAQKFHPEVVIEQAHRHGELVHGNTTPLRRALRYAGQLIAAALRVRWVYLSTLVTYAAGYAWGWLTLREDSL